MYKQSISPPRVPRIAPLEMGPDSWGWDGELDGVMDGPWVLKYEDVLLGLLS